VPVGVDDEGGIVVGVVALAQARRPVITPPAGEGGGVEGVHRLGIRSDEGEVERASRLTLEERQVLGVRRPYGRTRPANARRWVPEGVSDKASQCLLYGEPLT
jgi:hypothetical protein